MVGFLREADRVAGVVVRDLESGREFTVRAKQTINAAGVWIDELQKMLGGRGQLRVRASKGVHLVVPPEPHQLHDWADHPHREKPALHHSVGQSLTTDTDWQLDIAASVADIDYVLRHANTLLADPLKR